MWIKLLGSYLYYSKCSFSCLGCCGTLKVVFQILLFLDDSALVSLVSIFDCNCPQFMSGKDCDGKKCQFWGLHSCAEKGELLLREGSPGEGLYFLWQGEVFQRLLNLIIWNASQEDIIVLNGFPLTIDNVIEAIICCSIHLQAEVSLPSSGEKLGHTMTILKPGDYFGFGEGLLKDCWNQILSRIGECKVCSTEIIGCYTTIPWLCNARICF